jgi:hypothetical protein
MAVPDEWCQNVAMRRRDVLGLAAASVAAPAAPAATLVVESEPAYPLSPWLYMQFMEPLGTADSSVEAAWDYDADDWRADFVATSVGLAPGMLRWGGLYCRYYRWREGVGPVAKRPWMRNYVWGGKETNRVGTHEFVDLCGRIGAAPLMCVNFEGDGEERYRKTREGDRTAGAAEAADWVSYCNDPSNAERRGNGFPDPCRIRFWQLGNETSYGNVTFRRDQAIAKTIEFARAMKQRDPGIALIGWGDRGSEGLWAPQMVERAGEWIAMVAIHMMGQSPVRPKTVLDGNLYQHDLAQAWSELLELAARVDARLTEAEQAAAPMPLAVTEGHLSLQPSNANPILTEWLSSAYHAKTMNIYERHGARVQIATGADFEGNRWTVNALLLRTPGKVSWLTPAGAVMKLFGRRRGNRAVSLRRIPTGLDVTASRDSGRVYLHVANPDFSSGIDASFAVQGGDIRAARVYDIAPQDPRAAAGPATPQLFEPVEHILNPSPDGWRWRFPARSASVVELDLASLR